MRALLVWVCLLVVFDAATCGALRAVVQPEPVSADVRASPTPTLDGCADSALRADEPICTPEPVHNVSRDANRSPQHPCPELIDVKTTSEDEMCDVVAAACASQLARLCPSRLSDPQRLGN
jgi:hypothetical protein